MPSEEDTENKEFMTALAQAKSDFQNGNYAKAEPVLRQALHQLDENNKDLSSCLNSLSEIAAARGNFSEAVRMHLRLLAMCQSGKANLDSVAVIERIATLYEMTGRLTEAEYMHSRAQMLKEHLVWAEQEANQSEVEVLGPVEVFGVQPPWLQTAFDEANRMYRKQNQQPEPQILKYAAPEVDKLHNFRPEAEPQILQMRSLPKEKQPPTGEPPATIPRPRPASVNGGPDFELEQGNRQSRLDADNAHRLSNHSNQPDPMYFDKAKARAAGSIDEPTFRDPGKEGGSARQKITHASMTNMKTIGGNVHQLNTPSQPSLLQKVAAAFGKLTRRSYNDNQANNTGVPQNQRRSSMLLPAIFCFVLMGALGTAAWLYWPHAKAVNLTVVGERYQSFDQDKLFGLIDNKDCEFNAGPAILRTQYKIYAGDFRDALSLTFGTLLQKQYWLLRKPYGLEDADGTILYRLGSSELKLAKALEKITNEAAVTYLAQSHYPEKFTKEAAETLAYENPFSHKSDIVKLQQLALGSNTSASAQESDYARDRLYRDLGHGSGWQNRPPLYPGCIYCCSLILHSPRGDINTFLVQPADSQGKPFTASLPSQSFFIALEDGKTRRSAAPALPFHNQANMRPQVTWLLEKETDPQTLEFLKHGAIYICAGAAFFLLLLSQLLRSKFLLLPAGAAILATLMYLCANALP